MTKSALLTRRGARQPLGWLTAAPARNTAALTLAALAARVGGLVFIPAIARQFGSEGVGAYQLSTNLVGYFTLFALFGLSPLIVREMSATPSQVGPLFWRTLVNRLIFSSWALVGLGVLATTSGYPRPIVTLLAVLGVGLVASTVVDSAFIVFQAAQRMGLILATTVLQVSCYIGLGIVALRSGYGITGLAVASSTGVVVQAISGLAVVHIRFAPYPRPFPRLGTRAILAAGAPFFIATTAVAILARIDVYILSLMVSLHQVGYYLAGYIFLEIALIFPMAAATAVYPRLTIVANSPGQTLEVACSRYYRVVAGLCACCAAGCVVVAPELVRLLYGEGFGGSVPITRIVMVSLIFVGFNTVFGRGIYAAGGQWPLVRVTCIGAGFNIAANILLIPIWGIEGAAIVTVVTYAVMSVMHWQLAARYHCRPGLPTAFFPLAIFGAATAVGVALSALPPAVTLVLTSLVGLGALGIQLVVVQRLEGGHVRTGVGRERSA